MQRTQWTREQLILALEFYYKCDPKTHTDAHPKCQQTGAEIGRTAGALDGIIRNIKWVDTYGAAGWKNASQKIKNIVEEFRATPVTLFTEARKIRKAKNLPSLDCS